MENITKNKNWITVLIVGLFTLVLNAQHQHEKYQLLPFGSVKPSGWIKTQMQKDVAGFVGNLDRIVPDLINDPIYSSARLQKNSVVKDLGNNKEGDTEGSEQYKWWNSETQSNWWLIIGGLAGMIGIFADGNGVDIYGSHLKNNSCCFQNHFQQNRLWCHWLGIAFRKYPVL